MKANVLKNQIYPFGGIFRRAYTGYIYILNQFNKIYIEKVIFLRLLHLYLRLECLPGKIFIEYVFVLKGFD